MEKGRVTISYRDNPVKSNTLKISAAISEGAIIADVIDSLNASVEIYRSMLYKYAEAKGRTVEDFPIEELRKITVVEIIKTIKS